jgi:hypothetical protein
LLLLPVPTTLLNWSFWLSLVLVVVVLAVKTIRVAAVVVRVVTGLLSGLSLLAEALLQNQS